MLRDTINNIWLRMRSRINRSTIDIDRKEMCGASLGANSKPSRVVRERDMSNLGTRITSIERVDMLDMSSGALHRTRAHKEHVKVLT
jgi:hypothetical protein